ncbi:MAG: DUF3114 domain-containing protein, partial [Lactobacillaceae bacterium]|nr:DUF3114 domain-containing protein [Lactobacillaceae bacterium]
VNGNDPIDIQTQFQSTNNQPINQNSIPPNTITTPTSTPTTSTLIPILPNITNNPVVTALITPDAITIDSAIPLALASVTTALGIWSSFIGAIKKTAKKASKTFFKVARTFTNVFKPVVNTIKYVVNHTFLRPMVDLAVYEVRHITVTATNTYNSIVNPTKKPLPLPKLPNSLISKSKPKPKLSKVIYKPSTYKTSKGKTIKVNPINIHQAYGGVNTLTKNGIKKALLSPIRKLQESLHLLGTAKRKGWGVMPALLVSGLSTAATFIEQLFDSKNKKKNASTKGKGSTKKSKANVGFIAGFDKAVTELKKKIQKVEQQNKQDILIVKNALTNLKKQGYSKQVIAVYENSLKSQIKNGKIGNQSLSSYISESRKVGSKDFKQIFNDNSLTSKQKLNYLMNAFNMPKTDIPQNKTDIKTMLKAFSNVSPNDPFWRQLANTVQQAFPQGLVKSKDKVLAKQVNQFRYLISAQQAQYIRDNYGKPSDTDATKLADYLSGQPKRGSKAINKPVKYEQEKAPLHQKMKPDGQYPKGYYYANYKITLNFNTEFILDGKGNFVNEVDPQGTNQNGVVNGASFNYANMNSTESFWKGKKKYHDILDATITGLDPKWRETQKKGYKVPSESDYRNESSYTLDGKTAKQREDQLYRKFNDNVKTKEGEK